MNRAVAPDRRREIPRALPEGEFIRIGRSGHLLLCLDYDGTLAEIVSDPQHARPLPAVRDALNALARHRDKVTLAVITGREIEVVRDFLQLDEGILIAGVHGLSLLGRDGQQRNAPAAQASFADLDRLRDFLAQTVPAGSGFLIEDKTVSLALHYRNVEPDLASRLVARLKQFMAQRTPQLELLSGKMVVEALPAGAASKGSAVKFIIDEMEIAPSAIAYFGDDETDENAFSVVRESGGLTVLVGPERPSLAEFRIESPSDVANLLGDLAQRLDEAVTPA